MTTRSNPLPFWEVPPIWRDETAFIIGGGPSVKEAPLHLIHHRCVIGVNNAFELGQWVDICYFGDKRWWQWNKEALRGFGGLIVTCNNDSDTFGGNGRVRVLQRDGHAGIFSGNRRRVCWNRNSGSSAINLAVHLGARVIVLIGFDMKYTEGAPGMGHNWHDQHLRFFTKQKSNVYQKRFLSSFPAIKRDLDKLGIKCINANPDSALDVFPRMTLEEFLDDELRDDRPS